MENKKTTLGVSVGLMGAALYILAGFCGYTPFLLAAAYVFFKENNEWLKKVTVKALALALIFTFASSAVGLIPEAISLVDSALSLVKGSFRIPFVSNIVSLARYAISFCESIAFILLALQALKELDFPIAFVDKMVDGGVAAAEKAVSAVKKEEPKTEEKTEEAKSEDTAE